MNCIKICVDCVLKCAIMIVLIQGASHLRADDNQVSGRVATDRFIEARRIKITKDNEVFGESIADDSLVIDKGDLGISGCVIILDFVSPPVSEKPAKSIKFRLSKGLAFPRVAIGRLGDTIDVDATSDGVGYAPLVSGAVKDVMPPPDVLTHKVTCRIENDGSGMAYVSSATYPWIRGCVVVTGKNSIATLSDSSGHFEMKGLPKGPARLSLWHERLGFYRGFGPDSKCRYLNIDIGANNDFNLQIPSKLFIK